MDHVSLWQQTTSCRLPTVALPASAEAVIVGGGLCGLLTAYRLLQRGVNDIVVMDAGDIAGGVTAHTPAKITAQHGLCYQKLLQERGATAAAQYAAAAREAERAFPTLIRQLNIDCGYTPCPAAVYATDTDGARRLEQEAEALARLQLPFTADRTADLPFAVTAVLHTTGGGYFHPLQFAYALTDHLRRQGVTFCPRTAAVGLSEEAVVTTRGRVRTPVAVLTSHFPFLDMPGRYFMRIWQERAYVLAVAQVKPPAEMYWGAGKHDLSLRPYPNGVLIGGGTHRTGVAHSRHPLYQLRVRSAPWYPDRRVVAGWSAQDCMTPDGVPYIGRYTQADQPHMAVYLATGFNKWGMTGSMTAAAILAGSITGASPSYAAVFSPARHTATRKAFYVNNAQVLRHYIGGYARVPQESLASLHPGEGKLLTIDGKRVGAYRRRDGRVFLVKPTCPHMGCMLTWNAEECSWDCPCHGSRFDYRGRLLNTPAHRPLTRYKLAEYFPRGRAY